MSNNGVNKKEKAPDFGKPEDLKVKKDMPMPPPPGEDEEEAPPQGGPHFHDYRKPKDTKGTLIRIFGYMGKSKALVIFAIVLAFFSTGCSLYSSYLLKPIIDDYILPVFNGTVTAEVGFHGLAMLLLLLGAVYVLSAAATYLQSATMVKVANRVIVTIRNELFEKLQRLPLSYFDAHTHGELMSRFTNDADNIQMILEDGIIHFITSIVSFVGTVLIMLFLNWKLFIITFVGIVIISCFTKWLGKFTRSLFKKQQSALGILNGYIEEMVEGTKVVKAFTYEDRARGRFGELNEDYRAAATKANCYGGLLMPVGGQIMNICYGITTAVGGILCIDNGFTIGALGTYLQYSKRAGQPIQDISNQVVQLLSAIAGAERIFKVMDTMPELDDGKVTMVNVSADASGELHETNERTNHWAWKVPADERRSKVDMKAQGMASDLIHHAALDYETDNQMLLDARKVFGELMKKYSQYAGKYDLIEVKGDVRLIDVDFSYVPNKRVLNGITVSARPGQKIAFVGSTGAGKTTITNLINRFYDIDGGAITYDSVDIRDIKKDDLRRSLCMVLQDTHLFNTTVMENIRYGNLNATDEECIAAAKSANAHSFISRLPNGYQTVVTGDGTNLSQGQRQLLAIARAAVANPPVMILDEATSSIDTRTEKLIEKGLDTLMEGRTVFIIAHRLSTVRNSHSIAVIEHGEIIENGNHEELLANKGRYYLLYTGQTELS